MSITGRDQSPAPAASDLADSLDSAGFVRLFAHADGDSLAAMGVIARALDALGTPFQATVTRPFDETTRTTEADLTVSIGHEAGPADASIVGPDPASVTAFDVVRKLGRSPDVILAFAGVIASGGGSGGSTNGEVSGVVAEAAERAGLSRRPGVVLPVADPVDGFTHSTLVHAPFSGDVDAATEALSECDLADVRLDELTEDDGRRVASLLAIAVTGAADASDRSGAHVERALCPYVSERTDTVCGPFETVGGYADVLDATARERPGIGVSLALGHDGVCEDALTAWRSHAERAHRAVKTVTTRRYDGLFVARGDDLPIETVSRLIADFRSPEPVTLVVCENEAVARSTDGRTLDDPMDTAASATDGETITAGNHVRARFTGDRHEFVETFREAL